MNKSCWHTSIASSIQHYFGFEIAIAINSKEAHVETVTQHPSAPIKIFHARTGPCVHLHPKKANNCRIYPTGEQNQVFGKRRITDRFTS